MNAFLSILAAFALAALSGCTSPAPTNDPAPGNYQVFFDYDRATIGDDAAEILRQVALRARQNRTSAISLTVLAPDGNANAYDQALSERRAEAVKATLIKEGAAAEAISFMLIDAASNISPTIDGVREPQNRSTKIILR
jgi:OOP family OmpA-OmpF porin